MSSRRSIPTHFHSNDVNSYVDAQLQTSRRFDAAGIERDHPDIFVPIPSRRSSSSSSLASMSSKDDSHTMPEGQLRYWTAEMCSRTPQLFDFVVTVRCLLPQSIILDTHCTALARRRWYRSFHVLALPTHCTPSPAICPRLTRIPHQL